MREWRCRSVNGSVKFMRQGPGGCRESDRFGASSETLRWRGPAEYNHRDVLHVSVDIATPVAGLQAM